MFTRISVSWLNLITWQNEYLIKVEIIKVIAHCGAANIKQVGCVTRVRVFFNFQCERILRAFTPPVFHTNFQVFI